MIYEHRLLHVFLGLFVFYTTIFLLTITIYLLSTNIHLLAEVLFDKYIWMLYATRPLLIGMFGSLAFAFIIQWMYKSKIEGNKISARNTIGFSATISHDDIVNTNTYNIPFIPLSRLTLRDNQWSIWVTGEAGLAASKMV